MDYARVRKSLDLLLILLEQLICLNNEIGDVIKKNS